VGKPAQETGEATELRMATAVLGKDDVLILVTTCPPNLAPRSGGGYPRFQSATSTNRLSAGGS